MRHYTKDELECYRNHEMSVLGRINCSAHLQECEACTRLLLELEQDDSFISELRNSLKECKDTWKTLESGEIRKTAKIPETQQ